MRKLLVALLVTSFALPAVNGQGTATRGRMVPVPAAPKPAETAPKRSFFQRFFGPLPTPTPIPRPTLPAATPSPSKRRPRPKAKPVTEDVTPTVATPKTSEEPEVKATVKPPVKTTTKTKVVPTKAPVGMDDPSKFKDAKAKAAEDPAVAELKNKADSEVNEDEAQKAVSAYNRALFRKIREIDPSVSDYADRVEQSMTKRIGAEKGKE